MLPFQKTPLFNKWKHVLVACLMKTKYTVATIAMFAMILGMGVLAPAMAAKAPKVDICHFADEEIIFDEDGETILETIDAHWKILNVNKNGADNGHVDNHGDDSGFDFIISNDEQLVEDALKADCEAKENFQENIDEDKVEE